MQKYWLILIMLAAFLSASTGLAEDWVKRIKKSAEMSTLDQPGTPPFHLKAALAPSFERDRDSGRTGEIEIWWASPTRWHREVRCPEFHQVQIVDGDHVWQKNDGAYFPEWLREISNAIVRPVEFSDELVKEIRGAEVKNLMGTTYLSWAMMSSNGTEQKSMGADISMPNDSGLLFTTGGFGWGALYKDYSKFHNRQVARTVSSGSPEVTAKLTVLEDLGSTPDGWFDAAAPAAIPN